MNEIDTAREVQGWLSTATLQNIKDVTVLILLVVILKMVIINYREQKADRYATIQTLPTKELQEDFIKHYDKYLADSLRRIKSILGTGLKKILFFFKMFFR